MATGENESNSLEYTSTWIVAVVCFVIVLVSFIAERSLHELGKRFLQNGQDALFEALQKLKEELMLLGFISLLLTVCQNLVVRHFCIPPKLATIMLPCKLNPKSSHASDLITRSRMRLLSQNTNSTHCARKGKVPFMSIEALHHLHIFIFVLAVVHVIFCVTTLLLGGAQIGQWRHWEHSIRKSKSRPHRSHTIFHHLEKFKERAGKYWRKTVVVSWVVAFFKQFYGSVSKSDYIALRSGFIRAHIPSKPDFDFHKYMLRSLEHDFKKIVGISWHLWLFLVLFLLINLEGWHTYFWLAFLPLALLLLVGAKLEHIISDLAKEVAETETTGQSEAARVRPSDELFWFHRPDIILYLIHFILFQNAFEMGFFFWIWVTYGFKSCIMEKLGFIIPRIVIGVVVQVLCSYSTLPLYALVTQMGTLFKQGMFDEYVHNRVLDWAERSREKTQSMVKESLQSISVADQPAAYEATAESIIELSNPKTSQTSHS